MKPAVATALLLSLVVAVPGRARADWVNPYTGNHFNNPTSSLLDTMIRNRMNTNMLLRSLKNKQGDRGKATPAKHQPIDKTDFSAGKQRLVVATVIGALASTPEQTATLTTAMDQVFIEFEKAARKNNVAYSLTFLLAASLKIDRDLELSDEQSEQLALGINDLLADAPAFARVGASDRQKLYETCVTMGGLILLFSEVGKQGDVDASKAAKLLATQSLAMLGVK